MAPMLLLRWLAGSRAGRVVSAIGAFLLALAAAKRSGRKQAEAQAERDALEQYQDTRQRADEALRKDEGDTRPVDARLQSHGRLRDARMD